MKVNLHFMEAHMYPSIAHIKEHSEHLERAQYKSVLHVFDSNTPDYFVKIAHSLNTEHSFKYLVALRAFTISPQFCAMILKAFHEIQPNRIALNLLAGDFDQRITNKEANTQKDYKGSTDDIFEVHKRREMVRSLAKDLKGNSHLEGINVDIVFSGMSDYVIDTAEMFNAPLLIMIDDYYRQKERFKDLQKIMVTAKVVIRQTKEQAMTAMNAMALRDREKDFTIAGTYDSVLNDIKNLSSTGITDFLIQVFDNDFESLDLVHQLAYEYNSI